MIFPSKMMIIYEIMKYQNFFYISIQVRKQGLEEVITWDFLTSEKLQILEFVSIVIQIYLKLLSEACE